MPTKLFLAGLVGLVVTVRVVALVQEPRVTMTAFLDADGVHAGGSTRLAFEVRLPHGFHVNSNNPLDKYLIPTELKMDLPHGLAVTQTIYPEAQLIDTDFSDEPLSVFGDYFVVGVALDLTNSMTPGEYTVSAILRYQACDEKACYRPTSKEEAIVLKVVAKDRVIESQHSSIFDEIRFVELK